jgi:hypothetical protein
VKLHLSRVSGLAAMNSAGMTFVIPEREAILNNLSRASCMAVDQLRWEALDFEACEESVRRFPQSSGE